LIVQRQQFCLLGLGLPLVGLMIAGTAITAQAIPFRPNAAPKIKPKAKASKAKASKVKVPKAPPAKPKAPIDPMEMPQDLSVLQPAAQANMTPLNLPIAPPMPEPEVTSKPNLDYERLQQLMKAGEWTDANLLTSRILLTIGGGDEPGYLTATQIGKMSCTELKTVDDLWRYYSGARSGLVAQAKVWRQLQQSSTDSTKTLKQFETRVGWHKDKLTANPKTAQIGHLPFRPSGNGGSPDAAGGGWIQAMPERLATCGLIPQRVKATPAKANSTKKVAKKK
jgi:hypothetical protein